MRKNQQPNTVKIKESEEKTTLFSIFGNKLAQLDDDSADKTQDSEKSAKNSPSKSNSSRSKGKFSLQKRDLKPIEEMETASNDSRKGKKPIHANTISAPSTKPTKHIISSFFNNAIGTLSGKKSDKSSKTLANAKSKTNGRINSESDFSLNLPVGFGAHSRQCSNRSHPNEDTFKLVQDIYPISSKMSNQPNMTLGRHSTGALSKVISQQVIQYFAVFDGHGGQACSKFLRDNLHKIIPITPEFESGEFEKILFQSIKEAETKFFEVDDQELSGSCAIIGLLTQKKLLLANVGDCRGILFNKEGDVVHTTRDHKADEIEEKKRIEAAGGFIVRGRVFGLLAVSRSIGDREYKGKEVAKMVVSDPEIHEIELTDDHEFVVIASDGVWDTVDNETAGKIVHQALFVQNLSPQKAARLLIEKAVSKGSKDDCTAVVVQLLSNPNQLADDTISTPEGLKQIDLAVAEDSSWKFDDPEKEDKIEDVSPDNEIEFDFESQADFTDSPRS